MQCQDFRPLVDSYIKDELLVETNHEILIHADECSTCCEQLTQRRQFLARLKVVVNAAQESRIDSVFALRLTRDLKGRAISPSLSGRLRAAIATSGFRLVGALAGLIVVMVTSFYLVRSFNENGQTYKNVGDEIASNNLGIADAGRAAWTKLAAAATGDHENCAVKYNLAEDPITLDEAALKYGAFNKDLDKSLKGALEPEGLPRSVQFKYIESHSCVYEGRRFAHIVFEKQGKLVSILVTDSDLPVDSSTTNTMFAGFAVDNHAVFVVSELGADESARIARLIEPELRLHILSARA